MCKRIGAAAFIISFICLFMLMGKANASDIAVVVDAPLEITENKEFITLLEGRLSRQLRQGGYDVLSVKGVKALVNDYRAANIKDSVDYSNMFGKKTIENKFQQNDLKNIAGELNVNNILYLQLTTDILYRSISMDKNPIASVTWDIRLYDKVKNSYVFLKSYTRDNITKLESSAVDLLTWVLQNTSVYQQDNVMYLVNEEEDRNAN